MILDIILIFMFILSIIFGFKIGFLKYILNIASMFSGFILSILLVNPVSNYILSTFGNNIVIFFENKLANTNAFILLGNDANIKDLLLEIGLSNYFSNLLETILINMGVNNNNLLYSLSYSISNIIITICTFIFLWFGLSILIKIIKLFVDVIRVIPFIKLIDGAIGMLFATAIYFIIIFVSIAFFNYLDNISFINNFIISQLNSSNGIFKYFYENNIIINLIEIFIKSL